MGYFLVLLQTFFLITVIKCLLFEQKQENHFENELISQHKGSEIECALRCKQKKRMHSNRNDGK